MTDLLLHAISEAAYRARRDKRAVLTREQLHAVDVYLNWRVRTNFDLN